MSAESRDPDQLVELTIFEHEFVAHLLVNRLAEESIDAQVFALAGEQLGMLSAATAPHNGAQVRVRFRDIERAKEIANTFEQEHADSDDNI